MAYINGKKTLTKVLNQGGIEGVTEQGDTLLVKEVDKDVTLQWLPSGKQVKFIQNNEIDIYINQTKANITVSNATTGITVENNGVVNAENLEPQNIAKDVTILGVTGTFEGGSSGNTLKNLLDNTKSASYLFQNYQGNNINDLLQYNDTENVSDFEQTFSSSKITKFNYNTANAITFKGAFQWSKLITIKLDTPKTTNLGATFNGCYDLKKIDISYYNISSTTKCSNMASSCSVLKAFIIRSFGTNYVLNSNSFNDSFHMLGTTNGLENTEELQDGYLYVPRDMISTLQSATNWSILQFRALEDYTKDGTTTGEFDDVKAGLV